MPSSLPPSRRALLAGAALSLAPTLVRAQGGPSATPSSQPAPGAAEAKVLIAAPAKARIKPEPAPETPVWAFDGKGTPPVLRSSSAKPSACAWRTRPRSPCRCTGTGCATATRWTGSAG